MHDQAIASPLGRQKPLSGAPLRTMLLALLFMIMAAIGAIGLKPEKRLADDIEAIDLNQAIPASIGQWRLTASGEMVVRTAAQEDTLNKIYDQIVSRTYVNDRGEQIMLSVAYGSQQTQQLRAHRQEVCYAAQGFRISGLKDLNLDVAGSTVPATTMIASMPGRQEPVTYWFTMGDEVVRSYFDRQWGLMRYAASGYVPDGYLVRISMISEDSVKAFEAQRSFAAALAASVEPALARRLFGKGGEQ